MLTLIGDVHGEFGAYLNIISRCDKSIQLGDFGVGFVRNLMLHNPKYDLDVDAPRMIHHKQITNCEMPSEHKFIYGNHDNTKLCLKHPNCLGKWGMYKGLFFVSGGLSIDQEYRVEGRVWWREEELSISDGNKVLAAYEKEKPRIVISHDCPLRINKLLYTNIIPSRTAQLFDAMFDIHQDRKSVV